MPSATATPAAPSPPTAAAAAGRDEPRRLMIPGDHVQLGHASKIFTAASTAFGDDPNTHIDPVGRRPARHLAGAQSEGARARVESGAGAESAHRRAQQVRPQAVLLSGIFPRTTRSPSTTSRSPRTAWINSRWRWPRRGRRPTSRQWAFERLHMEEDVGKWSMPAAIAWRAPPMPVDYNRAVWPWRRSSASRICAPAGGC